MASGLVITNKPSNKEKTYCSLIVLSLLIIETMCRISRVIKQLHKPVSIIDKIVHSIKPGIK